MNENFMDRHFIPPLPTTKITIRCLKCGKERECDSDITSWICAQCILQK